MTTDRTLVDDHARVQYAGFYVLRLLKDPDVDANALIAQDERLLTPILTWLIEKDYAFVDDKDALRATSQGADVVAQFEQRYKTFLRDYDVFCAVDLEAGEFGLAHYEEYPNPGDWQAFLAQDRWDDLRVTVAIHEGIDPVEIIFMGLIKDGRFGRDEDGWNFDLLLGSIWDEVGQVCNSALTIEDLAFDDDGAHVDGATVVEEIIERGKDLMSGLRSV